MTTTISHAEAVEMIRRKVESAGLNLARFYELGIADALVDPELRDLWLTWRQELTPEDVA